MSIFRYMLSFDRIHRKHWTQNSPTYIWFYAIYFDHVCMLISFAQEPTWIHTKKVSKKKRPLFSLSLSLSLSLRGNERRHTYLGVLFSGFWHCSKFLPWSLFQNSQLKFSCGLKVMMVPACSKSE